MRWEKKGVIFDLDGVICRTDRYHRRAWEQLAGRLEIAFDDALNDRLRGVSRMDSLNLVLSRADRRFSDAEKRALAEEKNRAYQRLLRGMSPADLPAEVKDTLLALRARGYRLAVGSSSKNARIILEQLGLEDFFDAVADGTEIARAKPDPEVFLRAAAKLRLAPEDCAVVEDAAAGLAAAKAAGMTALALFGEAKGSPLSDYDLTSFSDLLNVL